MIDHTELIIADELGICGTMTELVTTDSFDGFLLNQDSPLLPKIRERFFKIVRGEATDPAFVTTVIPKRYIVNI